MKRIIKKLIIRWMKFFYLGYNIPDTRYEFLRDLGFSILPGIIITIVFLPGMLMFQDESWDGWGERMFFGIFGWGVILCIFVFLSMVYYTILFLWKWILSFIIGVSVIIYLNNYLKNKSKPLKGF